MTTDYRVHLEAFDGPLDLLLFLIRRAEVDISDIPIAVITEQYVEYLKGIDRIDIELAGEFLLMAATLMEIKSRTLMPSAAARETGEAAASSGPTTDPRADLVKQLLAYKKFRDAAGALEHRLEDWSHRFPTARALTEDPEVRSVLALMEEDPSAESTGAVDVDDLLLQDLVEAFHKIAESVNFERLGDHQITDDDTPIELHAEDLLALLRGAGAGLEAAEPGAAGGSPASDIAPGAPRTLTLQSIFRGRTRPEMIGLFLATLELVRRREIFVRQDVNLGQIVVGLRAPEEATLGAGDPPVLPAGETTSDPLPVIVPASHRAPDGPRPVAADDGRETTESHGTA
jgi:segregation and condensation protein A